MSKEQDSYFFNCTELCKYISFLLVINVITIFSFSRDISKKIKKESHGICAECQENIGEKDLIASHIVHGINNIKNGRALCKKCETRYHLSHADEPNKIGLSKKNNDPVVYGHVLNLPQEQREYLINEFPEQWHKVLKRLKRHCPLDEE